MNIDPILRSVVAVRSSIPEDAFTAGTLGTQREGSGVVIRDNGLVLTIGYLITEAEEVWLTTPMAASFPGMQWPMTRKPDSASCRRWVRSTARRWISATRPKAKAGDPVVLADGVGQSVEATSSPSRNSPATGNICSTRRSSPRPRIRRGAARRSSGRTASSLASARCACR